MTLREWLSPRVRGAREFFYGMTGYDFARHAAEMRGDVETLFMLATLGDLVGVPIMPPYYSLRLVPYVVPGLASWKRRVIREKDFTEKSDFDLHGL